MTLRCLVVEDEALLALELEDTLLGSGHEIVGTAMSKREAVALAERTRPDLAFVDIHLVDGPTGVEVARELVARDIPVVFMTANVRRIPPDFAGALGVIEKPYTMNGLENAVGFVTRLVQDGTGDLAAPTSLTLRGASPAPAGGRRGEGHGRGAGFPAAGLHEAEKS